jgi:hypothetical protein
MIGASPWNTLGGNFENFIRPLTSSVGTTSELSEHQPSGALTNNFAALLQLAANSSAILS